MSLLGLYYHPYCRKGIFFVDNLSVIYSTAGQVISMRAMSHLLTVDQLRELETVKWAFSCFPLVTPPSYHSHLSVLASVPRTCQQAYVLCIIGEHIMQRCYIDLAVRYTS